MAELVRVRCVQEVRFEARYRRATRSGREDYKISRLRVSFGFEPMRDGGVRGRVMIFVVYS